MALSQDDPRKSPEQAGTIPWRRGPAGFEILLITSSGGDRWITPKGWIEAESTPAETAARETWEEAGVEGILSAHPDGFLEYKQGDRMLRVAIYSLEVKKAHESWPEDFQRRRVWLNPAQAAATASDPSLSLLILSLGERLTPSGQS